MSFVAPRNPSQGVVFLRRRSSTADRGDGVVAQPAQARIRGRVDVQRAAHCPVDVLRAGAASARARASFARKASAVCFPSCGEGLFEVLALCRNLAVSRQVYYAHSKRKPGARAVREQALQQRLRALHAKSRGTYGGPRLHAALRAQGQRVAKASRRTSDAQHGAHLYPASCSGIDPRQPGSSHDWEPQAP